MTETTKGPPVVRTRGRTDRSGPPGSGDADGLRLGDLRGLLGPEARQRDRRVALTGLARDTAFYLAAVVAALAVPWPFARLALGVVVGMAVTALFVWGHDAAHGALYADRRTGDVLGTIALLPSLQPCRLWQLGHNRVHHGFTSLMAIDWIWRPWSPDEYRAASRLGRLGYRVERSLVGCGWHYLHRVWWDAMVRFRPRNDEQRRDARLSWAITLAWLGTASAVAWAFGGGWAVVAVVVVPWLVFTQAIAFITYLHHTHPSNRFVARRADWDPVRGHVSSSTVVHLSRPVRWLVHDICIHTPHHLDTRVPYYRLADAWARLRPTGLALGVVEYDFSWSTVRHVFAACKLFDPETGEWSTFAEARGGSRTATAATAAVGAAGIEP